MKLRSRKEKTKQSIQKGLVVKTSVGQNCVEDGEIDVYLESAYQVVALRVGLR